MPTQCFASTRSPKGSAADRISISTNSQSAVKPRDLRSNDRRVLAIKRTYEQKYPTGYFITKRGEEAPANKDKSLVIDLLDLGKYMMAWHSQRPNVAYSENRMFDKHFEQLFKRNREYSPENVRALHCWMQEIWKRWKKENPLGLNESLLAMKSYAPYHHLYAVSLFFSHANGTGQSVPNPAVAYERATHADLVGQIVDSSGTCLNSALEAAANEQQPANRVFSPQNWIKTKTCLAGIRQAIGQYFNMLPAMPGGSDLNKKLATPLRWKATNLRSVGQQIEFPATSSDRRRRRRGPHRLSKANPTLQSRSAHMPPINKPPFTFESAVAKVRVAEDAWNSRDPVHVSLGYSVDSEWRNRDRFVRGRQEIQQFLAGKWERELDYRLIKELWAFTERRIAVRFQYEWHNEAGQWFRSYGNELWEFDDGGLMRRREASINDVAIATADRKFFWPAPGPRPADHPGLAGVR